MTRALRTSRWWQSFREELGRRRLEPGDTVLIDAFDDDEDVDIGLLQTSDDRLIAWRRRYSDEESSADEILEWNDVTQTWDSTLWRETAAAYLDAVRHERPEVD